jgi:hypothetical protein
MEIINRLLEEELKRLGTLHDFYEKKIMESPRGSLSVKARGKNRYLYLARREDKKVVFEYVGKDVAYVRHALNEQMKQRRSIGEASRGERKYQGGKTVASHKKKPGRSGSRKFILGAAARKACGQEMECLTRRDGLCFRSSTVFLMISQT